MGSISIHGVRKSFGPVHVLHNVDLDIADGEFIVLVGPSGCGKSTLLRMIAGLEEVTAGEISIAGRRVNDLAPKDRDIAMVFQSYALYPHMNVAGNMSYSLRLRKAAKETIAKAVAGAAAKLGLDPLLERRPKALSGGQRQRVAMGRAIVRQPKAFLFDEPLSNLDAKLRGQMRIEIRRLQRSLKTTSVYVTHDQLEAMTLADRLVVMNGGRIEQVGKPIELYDRPASLFVAGFIGSPPMNLMPVETLAAIAGATMPELPHGTDIVGIRPDRVVLGTGEGIALSGTVELIEPVGGESHLYVRVEGIEQALILVQQGRASVGEADRIDFVLPVAALHGFNRESGKRVE
jgi:sn-glycerol 3-phosphate transport system ATP-binding protein